MNFKNKNTHLILAFLTLFLLSFCVYWAITQNNKGLIVVSILFMTSPLNHIRKYFIAKKDIKS